jgi:3-oxoacyl-[acyl-carrier-protein] synthase-3
MKKSVSVVGTGAYLPERIITNADIVKKFNTSDEWIKNKVGISERRRASADQATSDLAIPAVEEALANAHLKADDLDLIICSRHVGDYSHPATACLIQHKIRAKNAAAFDMQAGCSGFIFSTITGANFITSGHCKYVAVVNVCLHSKYLNMESRWIATVFGDGAGAVILKSSALNSGILSFSIKSDGSGFDLLSKPGGGTRIPITHEVLENPHLLYGKPDPARHRAVFNFAVDSFFESIRSALDRANLQVNDIDLLISHQANINIIEAGMERLGLPMDRTLTTIHRYGNCAEASIPITLHEAVVGKKIVDGNIVAFTGFGAGLSWGAIIMRWDSGRPKKQRKLSYQRDITKQSIRSEREVIDEEF